MDPIVLWTKRRQKICVTTSLDYQDPRQDQDGIIRKRIRQQWELESPAAKKLLCTTRRRESRIAKVVMIFVTFLSRHGAFAFDYINPSIRRHSLSPARKFRGNNQVPIRMQRSHTRMSKEENTGDEKQDGDDLNTEKSEELSKMEKDLLARVTRLEELVAKQEVEIHRLKTTCSELTETTLAFARVVQLLREAGLEANELDEPGPIQQKEETVDIPKAANAPRPQRIWEKFDDKIIFGTAPTSVIDAADSAGAAILAAMLGGKQRMLVDVRDAELSRDPEILVQFIELAILPIAAGLEGLKSTRNRVKIVFPKVSQLLEYRRTMALAAPEVVALSTLGFDPVEKRDKLVLVVAPAPDDEEGLAAMAELLSPSDPNQHPVQQPVVILNYHMVPVSGLADDFETAYHLRLLTVQYMSDTVAQKYFQQFESNVDETLDDVASDQVTPESVDVANNSTHFEKDTILEDEALEAAMKHAHEIGMNQGITRAMVIRAYPK